MTTRMTPVVSAWDSGHRADPSPEQRASFTTQVSDEVISRATYGGDPDANGLSAAAACTLAFTRLQ